MTYLYQAIRAWLVEWLLDHWIPLTLLAASKWQPLKANTAAAGKKLINAEGK